METFQAVPDYTYYLAYIFTQMKPGDAEPNVRWRAGIALKNNIRSRLDVYTPEVVDYLKDVIFCKTIYTLPFLCLG